MDDFVIPEDRDPSLIGEIGFAPAFHLTLEYDGRHIEETPHGDRILRRITGGTIFGRIEGTVYPHGAGEFSLRREDGVTDINGHVLLQDDSGEWFYIRNIGYSREDGYFRVSSWVDVDVRGQYGWALGLLFVGIARPSENGGLAIDYYEVL
jgi:hypothetical protein